MTRPFPCETVLITNNYILIFPFFGNRITHYRLVELPRVNIQLPRFWLPVPHGLPFLCFGTSLYTLSLWNGSSIQRDIKMEYKLDNSALSRSLRTFRCTFYGCPHIKIIILSTSSTSLLFVMESNVSYRIQVI